MNLSRIFTVIILFALSSHFTKAQNKEQDFSADYRYSPGWWQTAISLPESSRKVVVDKNGQLMYEYPASVNDPGIAPASGFGAVIGIEAGENVTWKDQHLYNSRVPMVITQKEGTNISVREEAFTVAPLLFGAHDPGMNDFLGTSLSEKITGQPGNDIIMVTLENKTGSAVTVSPEIRVNTIHPAVIDTSKGKVTVSGFLRVIVPYSIIKTSSENRKSRRLVILTLKPVEIPASGKVQLAIGVSQGYTAIDCPDNLQQALYLQKQSIGWWEKLDLPYNRISVPDREMQNLLEASVRNIYQITELKNELPVLNTGISTDRHFSMADAPFMINALTMLNQADDAQKALEYLFTHQKKDGSFLLQEKDWKETGFALWAVSGYARLTGDKVWLESVWPVLENGFNFLIELQKSTLQSKASYAGLLPPGYGSDSRGTDYVNNYVVLAGLNSAITAARWIGRNGQAIKWQSLYDDYYNAFLEATKKSMRKDTYGNSYLPALSGQDKKTPPQKAQGAFLTAVYPGRIFDLENPVLTGNMKMLGRSLKEGLIMNTGKLNNLDLPSSSEYAHALQWTGRAQESANVLYALARHASPTLGWFRQQPLQGAKDTTASGDMPNSRMSAEFIRLVRHLIVMERGYELHLLEGVPSAWTKPGMEIKLQDVLTDFGPLDLRIKISDDGKTATLDMNLDTTDRRPPQRILLHLDGIAGNPATVLLDLKPNLHRVFELD